MQPAFEPRLVTRRGAEAQLQVRLGPSDVLRFPPGCPHGPRVPRKSQRHEDRRDGHSGPEWTGRHQTEAILGWRLPSSCCRECGVSEGLIHYADPHLLHHSVIWRSTPHVCPTYSLCFSSCSLPCLHLLADSIKKQCFYAINLLRAICRQFWLRTRWALTSFAFHSQSLGVFLGWKAVNIVK